METVQQNGSFTLFSSKFHSNIYIQISLFEAAMLLVINNAINIYGILSKPTFLNNLIWDDLFIFSSEPI